MNPNEKSLLQETKKFGLLILTFLIVFGGYQFFMNRKIRREGIYVKAEVISSEKYKGGTLITIRYLFKGNTYTARVRSSNGKETAGTIYLLQLLPNDPEAIILLDDQPVPACLATIETPPEGWKEIPRCK
jgi:hypothetical protein